MLVSITITFMFIFITRDFTSLCWWHSRVWGLLQNAAFEAIHDPTPLQISWPAQYALSSFQPCFLQLGCLSIKAINTNYLNKAGNVVKQPAESSPQEPPAKFNNCERTIKKDTQTSDLDWQAHFIPAINSGGADKCSLAQRVITYLSALLVCAK